MFCNEDLAQVAMLGETLSNPYFETYPAALKYATAGHQPIQTRSFLTEKGQVQFGLVLDSEYTAACPATCDTRRRLHSGSDECAACP